MEDQQLFFPFCWTQLATVHDIKDLCKVPTGPDSAQPMKKQVTPPHGDMSPTLFGQHVGSLMFAHESFANFLLLYSKILLEAQNYS